MTGPGSSPSTGPIPDLPSEPRGVGSRYSPDVGEHAGHVVRVVATDMPAERFGRVSPHVTETWVECSCGASWGYVEDEAVDGDGWPD